MAATLIEKTMPANVFSGTGTQLVWTALDNANGNYFPAHRDCLLLIWNTDASPQTFQLTSEKDPLTQRMADISEIVPAGEVMMYRLARMGWADTDDIVNVPSGQNANMKVALIPMDTEPA